MTKPQRAAEIARRQGLDELINKTKNYIDNRFSIGYQFQSGPAAPYLKKILGDLLHQKLLARSRLGYWPRIQDPRTFNEKILHRKLYTNNELFSTFEDKWAVREYVSDKVGDWILPDVYHVTDDPETILLSTLPEEFVVKPTHMSGPIIIVDETDSPDPHYIKSKCRNWLRQGYGQLKEEYWYEDIEPRIIIEERLNDDRYYVPKDYKMYVFHGRVEFISVYEDRFDESKPTKLSYFDRNWNYIDVRKAYIKGGYCTKPDRLPKLISISERLSNEIDFIRVDLYLDRQKNIHFGELTVAEGSGMNPFSPSKYDFKFGSHW